MPAQRLGRALLEQYGQPWLRKPCPLATIRRVLAQVLRIPAVASALGAAGAG